MTQPIRRRETQVVLSDSRERYRRVWLPADARRVLILIHGFGEHSGRYDEMAMYFARAGFAVHAYDQAGHGRTVGPRGHVDRFDRLVEEAVRFVELVGDEHPGLPVTLVGHSMGGLVVAGAAVLFSPPVDRFVLSGALLRMAGAETGLRRRLSLMLAHVLARIAPRFAIATGLDAEGISRDPEVVRRYREDPYVEDRMTTRFAAGLDRLLPVVVDGAARVDRPMLVLHGEEDPLTSPLGSEAFYAGLAPEIAAQSVLRIYPGLRHEIFQEPERAQVWDDVLEWLGEPRASTEALPAA